MDVATISKSAAVASSVMPSRAFIESMRPTGLVEMGSAIATMMERTKAITRSFDTVALAETSRLAATRANWFSDIERIVNPLGQVQKQLGGISDLMRMIQPLHERLAIPGDVVNRVARQTRELMAGVVSKLDCVVGSGVAPWAKIGVSMMPPTGLFGLHSTLMRGFGDVQRGLWEVVAPLGDILSTNENFAPLHEFLLDRSWYLSLDIPLALALELLGLVEAGEVERVEELLAEWARENLADIELSLIAQYPNRRRIFEDAFNAHREGRFTLSIPTLLAQVDGLSHELWQAPFFCARESTPLVEKRLEQFDERSALRDWLRPLTQKGSLRENTRHLPKDRVTFNRHLVMHGLRPDYASEIDSLKCIALLEFVRSVSFVFEVESDDDD